MVQTHWKGSDLPQQRLLCVFSYLLYLGDNLVLWNPGESPMPIGLEEGAMESGGDHAGHSFTHLYGAPGSKGRVAYVGWFEGLSSQKRTLILTIKGPVVRFGQFLTKMLKTGARLGKFGWDGKKGRGTGVRVRLQVQSLPRGNREPQRHALGSRDTLTLKTED